MSAGVNEVVEFLTFLFESGEGYSAINSARSALSTMLTDRNNLPVGKVPAVRRFMKGVFRLRPSLPRYSCIWDVNIVLDFLKVFYPNEELPLSHLTLKLTMLLALTTAQRAQTLHVLDIKDFQFYDDVVKIPIIARLKQTNVRNNKFKVELRSLKEDPSICVVECLKSYLKITQKLRTSSKLLISFLKPHNRVSKQTISRWIKKVMFEAGIDTEIFKSHSTRAAVCSKLKNNSVPIEEIIETAGWANAKCFKKFYDKVILVDYDSN